MHVIFHFSNKEAVVLMKTNLLIEYACNLSGGTLLTFTIGISGIRLMGIFQPE